MKKFIVLRKIGNFPASEERSFDDFNDAVQFAGLCNKSVENDYTTYHIAELQP